MDQIRIDGLELRCIVGLRSYERRREQPLRLDIGLGLDLSGAGRSGRIKDTADYARVADEVAALLQFRQYRLLEALAEEAAAFLFANHPAVQQVRLRVNKPEALAGRASAAAVEVTRSRTHFGVAEEATSFGGRTVLLHEAEALVELLRLAPGRDLSLVEPTRRLETAWGGPSLATGMSGLVIYEPGQRSEYAASAETLWICRCVSLTDAPEPLDV